MEIYKSELWGWDLSVLHILKGSVAREWKCMGSQNSLQNWRAKKQGN